MSLEALARGLRAAGGILNPEVQKINAQEDQQADAERRQENLLKLKSQLDQATLQASPQYQAQLQALQNEKGFRDAWGKLPPNASMLDRASVAAQYGKPELSVQLYQGEQNRLSQMETRRDALVQRMYEFDERLKDRSLDRESKERLAAQADETKRVLGSMTAEIAKNGQELRSSMLDFTMRDKERQNEARKDALIQRQYEFDERMKDRALDRESRERLAEQAAENKKLLQELATRDKADKDTRTGVRQLGQALEKANLPEADAVLSAVEQAIEKSPNLTEFLAGPKSAIPDAALGAVPGLKNAPEIREGRQAFQKLFNITLKNRSGAAVTNPEFERLKAEFANGVWKTPEQLQAGVNQARGIIQRHYASVSAGYGPDVVNAYNDNLGAMGLGKAIKITGSPSASGGPSGESSDPLGLRK